MTKILEAKNVTFSYSKKEILNNINLSLFKGDVLSLLGANGSGKSTLLKLLLGFYKSKGEVLLFEKDINSYSKKEIAKIISYVPQTHKIPFSYSVFDVVLMGRLPHIGLFSNYSQKDRDIVNLAIERVGILDLKNVAYSKISGGERQLIFIARALAQGSKVIFMDEPVSGLDYGNQIKLLKLLKEFSKDGYTFLKTTHYPDHALYSSNKIAMLKDGNIISYGDSKDVLNAGSVKLLYGVDVDMNVTSNYTFFTPKIL